VRKLASRWEGSHKGGMRACRRFPGSLALFVLALVSVARADGQAPPAAPKDNPCILSWPEARMQAYGYNHIVHVKDVCDAAADCVITTDVNPEPTKLSVAGKSEAEVNTYLGSPSRVFTPKVVCTMRTK
jgi:hypothetical protein